MARIVRRAVRVVDDPRLARERGGWLVMTMRKHLLACLAALILAPVAAAAQVPPWSASSDVEQYISNNRRLILADFVDLLAIPNVASDNGNIERNAGHLVRALEQRGVTTRILTSADGKAHAVIGELNVPHATQTLIFYAHFDGQPATQAGWTSDPFKPVLRAGADPASPALDWRTAPKLDGNWRIYARSAGDDKISIQAMLSALDALHSAKRQPTVNLRIFYEGEEEAGSPHLAEFLAAIGKRWDTADLLLIGDGPRHQNGDRQIILGVRGVVDLDVTTYGPIRGLHDGHYGNWAPNPAASLVGLLASLRNDDGDILIDGFYDDVRRPTEQDLAEVARLPDVETGLREQLALGRTESGGKRLTLATMRPALNIRGLRMGQVGAEASNTIYPEARASIDFRLVPGQLPERVKERLEAHLSKRGWTVVHGEPSAEQRKSAARLVRLDWQLGYRAYSTDREIAPVASVVSALERIDGKRPIVIPMLGGSVPIAIFSDAFHVPAMVLPVANFDDNQHAANENVKLDDLWDAVRIYASLLTIEERQSGTRQ